MILSNLAKLLIGMSLAIAILIGGGFATAMYLMNKVTAPPPKPVFANEQKTVKAKHPPSLTKAKSPTVFGAKPTAKPTPSETPLPQPLEPGAYRARVTWSEGLILRSTPDLDAERLGGIGYNQQIVVLEESADKIWQRIRLEDSEQGGWIKAGNTERIESEP